MHRLLGSLALLLAVGVSANAHFIFMLPADGSRTVQVTFADELKPDDVKYLKKISHLKCYVAGTDTPLDVATGKEALEVTAPGKGPAWLVGGCTYGVFTKGKDTFLLTYYARSLVGAKAADGPAAKAATPMKLDVLPKLDGKDGPVAQVLWDGKPIAEAEVVLYVPGKDDTVTTKTDADGMVKLTPAAKAGLYAIRARHMADAKGKHDGTEYSQARSYATCVFAVDKMNR